MSLNMVRLPTILMLISTFVILSSTMGIFTVEAFGTPKWSFARVTQTHRANKKQHETRLYAESEQKKSKGAVALMADLKRKVGWKIRSAQRSASLYLNPATNKIGKVTVSWEPDTALRILEMKTTKVNQGAVGNGRPFMVGVVGIPGSGKSTSSDILASMLTNSIVMPMDGYHYSMEQLKKFQDPADAIYRRGAPDTFDPASLEKALQRIVNGDEPNVSIPGFDHAKGDPEQDLHTFARGQHDVVICEGIYLMHNEDGWENIKNYFDWIIYIDADIDTCISRLKERNKCIPGYTPEEIELRCDQVDRKNAETVERSRHFATMEVKSGVVSAVQGLTEKMEKELEEFVESHSEEPSPVLTL